MREPRFSLMRVFLPLLGILSPLFPLYAYFRGNFYNVLEPFSLAMIFGITAYIYFLNVLIISTRKKFLDRYFGHDRVMQFHGYMATAAFVFAVIHRQLKIAVFPVVNLQTRLGNAAFIIFLTLIAVTVIIMVPGLIHRFAPFAKLRNFITRKLGLDYSILKFFHNFLVLAVLLLSFHVFLASSTQESWGRIILMALWSLTALVFWLDHKLFRPFRLKRMNSRVENINLLEGDIRELYIRPPQNFTFTPGQFVFVGFPGSKAGNDEHPYTISSAPGDSILRISAKNLGNFSNSLRFLQENDPALIDGPYGRFYPPRDRDEELIFIAGGIGITPLLSILRDMAESKPSREQKIVLFWAVRSPEDLCYREEIVEAGKKINSMNPGMFHFVPVVQTRGSQIPEAEEGFLTQEIIRNHCEARDMKIPHARVYFCGPPAMRRYLFPKLHQLGIQRKHIHFEMFSLG
ncbi:ferredoxin reductase family protein [Salinispira pacifica]|uniref:Benzoate 1,2-dioxygenase, ferredoxin reductase component n=1 Tax=Salinispira pacifica TaxID=1307761 RepID=V5WEE1_9SPIO|nr:benzoate 1 2-dioxygenase ferredoxin reductase [Salinispira pacifica]AHC13934.1 Benzoate 1,2-dioxygenase, ferredoxin reductase component [Salinispira pacifica]